MSDDPADAPATGGTPATEERDDAEPHDHAEPGVAAGQRKSRKTPSAFRTISEVADDLHIPQHVLRFWETKFPQVKPLKRGGGRRYYRPDDITLLRRISALLYIQGYTIKGVQRLLREGGGKLADDIPPPPAEESESAAAAAVVQSELPIPGLAPASPPPPRLPTRPASRGGADAETEIARLRTALTETLATLEMLRAKLGD